MAALCDYIREHADSGEKLTLAELAAFAHLSPGHLQRTFRAAVGVSPREFVAACRLEALKQGLRSGESVTRAVYDAGFSSGSRVYEGAERRLGMTPGEYREGGRHLEISYAVVATPLGRLLLAATDRGVCSVRFGDDDASLVEALRREYPAATLIATKGRRQPQFRAWVHALVTHLRSGAPLPDLPLAVRASAFRLRVWRYLQRIPAGETRSYRDVARAVGRPTAVRAVAGACAANPLAVVVPCHRVLRADGTLGGYRWGVKRKQELLARERQHATLAPRRR
jgi:AraC family transcriptional regulator of adaptative response/methylated-DNA-[protein]-cysteine methyltransferase